jgi:hypothetical protein
VRREQGTPVITYLLVAAIALTPTDANSQPKGRLDDWNRLRKLHRKSVLVIETPHGDESCRFDAVTDERIECERGTGRVPIIYTIPRSDVTLVWLTKAQGSQAKPIILGALIGAAAGAGVGVAYSGSTSGTVAGRTAAVGALIGVGVGFGIANQQHGASRRLIYQRPPSLP